MEVKQYFRLAKKIIHHVSTPIKKYENYEQTLQALKKFNGYDDNTLIENVYGKTKKFIENLKSQPYQVLDQHHLFLLTIIGLIENKQTIKVLDFGGAFGTHYYIVKTFFPHIKFKWVIIELPSVIMLGKNFENSELSFLDIKGNFENIIDEFDLVLTSATLQHMSNPEKTLEFLVKHNAPFFALLRLGLHCSQTNLWVIHKVHYKDCGPGVPLPNCPNKIAAFTFCLLAEHKLRNFNNAYQLRISNPDLSGTIHVPNHHVKGFNQLYTLKKNLIS